MAVVLSVLVSAMITWLVARWFYRKQTEDLEERHERLLHRIADVLRVEDAHKLSLDELEEIVIERGYPTDYFGIVPAVCPECGTHTDSEGGVHVDRRYEEEYPWLRVFCTNPGCDWTQMR